MNAVYTASVVVLVHGSRWILDARLAGISFEHSRARELAEQALLTTEGAMWAELRTVRLNEWMAYTDRDGSLLDTAQVADDDDTVVWSRWRVTSEASP